MVIHVKDETTDWLVREFARRRGLGITEAIKTAVQEASVHEKRQLDDVLKRLEPILAEIRASRSGGFEEAQRFINEGWADT